MSEGGVKRILDIIENGKLPPGSIALLQPMPMPSFKFEDGKVVAEFNAEELRRWLLAAHIITGIEP